MTLETTPEERTYFENLARSLGTGFEKQNKNAFTVRLCRDFATLERTLDSAVATLELYRNGISLNDPLAGPTKAAAWLDAYYKEKP